MKHMRAMALAILLAAILSAGCVDDADMEERNLRCVNRRLLPSRVEVKGEKVLLAIEDLGLSMTVDASSDEVMETPSLKGRLKIVNTSKDLLEVEDVTVEYMDQAGSRIGFGSEQLYTKGPLVRDSLVPGESYEGPFDVTFPPAAVEELKQIAFNMVYASSPAGRETLTMAERVE
jgi:hypothetical protein